ncbi:cytochrome c-type biogenesis protein CcmH [Shimia isoporae]|uniref:Cytochrome c-type biogenesis protein n=1 Tax=Shimia isoporae TaxID=647720 RepID=A0A4R1N374_9RHOB|nr:cytochrome c-type biogenesis protein [Shimia isoporae]TCL00779.1 cytochrome c-type biogenesis protein CcmH [Shimia isoporae]
MKLKLVLSVILFALAAPTWALDADEMFADPAQEERARDIGRQLRCLKCRNQSIFDSNAGFAKDLRVLVRERMTAGDTDEEVLEFVRDRYGDYVLMKPPVEAHTFVLWITPAALLILGLGGLGIYLKRRQPTIAQGTILAPEDRQEARRLLDQGEQP